MVDVSIKDAREFALNLNVWKKYKKRLKTTVFLDALISTITAYMLDQEMDLEHGILARVVNKARHGHLAKMLDHHNINRIDFLNESINDIKNYYISGNENNIEHYLRDT